MNALDLASTPVAGRVDLAALAAPGRLVRPARLYAVVVTMPAARPAPSLPGRPAAKAAAVFAAGRRPGVSFLLHERASSVRRRCSRRSRPDAAALDAWYGALLSRPGLPHGDAEAGAAGRRASAATGCGTQRDRPSGRLAADRRRRVCAIRRPPRRMPPAAATSLLVLANQITRRGSRASGEVAGIDTAHRRWRDHRALEFGGAVGGPCRADRRHALRQRDAAQRQRWQARL